MANFFSRLFGSRHADVKCQANDPNNCRFHHTGRFSKGWEPGIVGKEDAVRPDEALTPTERELARIKAERARENPRRSPLSGYLTDWFMPAWESRSSAWTPPPPPRPRSPAAIEEEIKKASPPNLEAVKALGNYETADGRRSSTRVSPLTGKGISHAMNTIINALMCGVPVKDFEIEATPEWKDAEKRYRDYSDSLAKDRKPANSWADTSEGRKTVRDEVYAKMSSRTITRELNGALKEGESYEVEKGFRFDIVSGLPAGGKNYTFADRLSIEHRARLADADVVKALLPGYADGLGANIVHDESTYINKDILDDTFRKSDPKYGDNIVYPTLGGNPSKLIDFIEQAHEAGYKVCLHLNEIDANKAKGRMLYRMIQTGRFLPLRLFAMTGDTVKAYMEARAYADEAEWYRSDAGKGIEPKKIEAIANENPKRRPPPPKFDAPHYGLFGYAGAPGCAGGSAAGEASSISGGAWPWPEDDLPESDYDDLSWLDDDAFCSDPAGYEVLGPGRHEAPAAKGDDERSGMSIDDILESFRRRSEGGKHHDK